MGIQRIQDSIENILNRTDAVKGRGEEATKQAMVLPFIEALGYNIWNPAEVCPEYEADTAIKKSGQKEKVDLAILLDDEPKIFIEVKAYGEDLDGHHGQLKRYFTAAQTVTLGILTNGSQYRFFTDTGVVNIQDDDPFFVCDFEAIDQGLDIVARFQKDVFSGEAIREFATELNYTEKMVKFLRSELDVRDKDLSENFIRWILASPDMYEGRVTINVVERFQPIAKDALQRVIRTIVRRSVAAIDVGVSSPEEDEPIEDIAEIREAQEAKEQDETECADQDEEEICVRKGIVTTEEELEGFSILKRQFETSVLAGKYIYDPAIRQDVPIEIGYKDTTGYFSVYFNKPSWWNVRLALDGLTKWIGIDIDVEKGKELLPPNFELLKPTSVSTFRIKINSLSDINTLYQLIIESFQKTIRDREELRIE